MKTIFRKFLLLKPSLWRLLFSSIACSCLTSPLAVAQIIPDKTLGDESSVVVPDVDIKGLESDRLEGGAVRGNNLFHSFQEFNIKAGRGAYFANPAVIENIFSRVTGVNPSEIFGTLGVLGNANLFLINPNGIIFGENASLDLRGSFFGTTADSIIFPDGKDFSATNPGLPPLLTVNVQQPMGLKFEGESGIITNAADLAVAPGQTLTLVGGDVNVNGGSLKAPGGRIDLGGLSAAGEIGIKTNNSLSFPEEIEKADVTLTNAADVDVQAGGGGFIAVNTRNLKLREGSRLLAGIRKGIGGMEAIGGDIEIKATESITLENASISNQVNPEAQGNSGNIIIDTDFLSITEGAVVAANTFGRGDGGAIFITASNSIVLSGEDQRGLPSSIENEVKKQGEGTARGITINTGSLSITEGTAVAANTFGIGDGGAISITATDSIFIGGANSRKRPSGIVSKVDKKAKGNSGGITINTSFLSINDGTIVNSSTAGVGNAGKILMNVTDTIAFSGENSRGLPSVIFSQVEPKAQGNSEGITINTKFLLLRDGAAVSATTRGVGNPGVVKISATDAISLEGESSIGIRSAIISRVDPKARGKSGGITIDTGSLYLKDGTEVSANIQGEGEAGNILITAKTLEAYDGSQIRTNTTTDSKAADITLEISDNLFLSGTNSGLFAQTEAVGTAGNIIVNSPQLTIDRGASISAFTTSSGDGGTITVNAPQAVLLTDNSQLTVETSGAGKPGDITITSPNLTIGKDAEISATATETSTNNEGGGNITINSSNLDLTGKLGIFAETQGEAPAGTLNIKPDKNKPNLDIQFTDTAIISASTTASGKGGDINLTAPETINITGQGKVAVETTGTGNAGSININTQNFNIGQQTEISASTFSSGQAGSIFITADNFNLTEGATVITNTAGKGKAGDIRFQITDSLNLVNSRIEASTEQESSGDGGSIFIDSQTVTLIDSQIAVNSQGKGVGGNIDLQAGNLTLREQSALTAETVSTDGGEIKMTLGGNLVLRDRSNISATAGTAQAGGDGGNIDINAQFILAFPAEDSNITANAFEGNGGNISITAEGILGIEFRENPTILSDITASSELGLAGTVEIDTPETDPNRGLVTLPRQSVDTELARGCDVEGKGRVAFYNLGRGGLAASPDDFLMADTVIGEWLPLAPSLDSFPENQKLSFKLMTDHSLVIGIKPLVPSCWR